MWTFLGYWFGWPDESDCADASHKVVRPCLNLTGPALLPIPPNPKVEGGISGDNSVDADHHIRLSPGPNSHFYTADAAECAYLKQLQASTPATQQLM